jgi:dTDP-4-dehydrorhamnose reductase
LETNGKFGTVYIRAFITNARCIVTDWSKVIITGGSGLLGGELKLLLPAAKFPSSEEFNVTSFPQMRSYAEAAGCQMVVHAAAFTSPPMVEKDPLKALEVNITGTANVVKLCMELDCRMIYISTDYVFKGDKGRYKEDDPVYPVNKYAWSKLGGECAVRMYDKALIIRISFGPNVFAYPKAFIDQWTSRESVSAIARKIVLLLDKDITGVIHAGGKRRTVYEYAKSLDESKEIGELSIKDVSFTVPVDTSLNCDKFREMTGQ